MWTGELHSNWWQWPGPAYQQPLISKIQGATLYATLNDALCRAQRYAPDQQILTLKQALRAGIGVKSPYPADHEQAVLPMTDASLLSLITLSLPFSAVTADSHPLHRVAQAYSHLTEQERRAHDPLYDVRESDAALQHCAALLRSKAAVANAKTSWWLTRKVEERTAPSALVICAWPCGVLGIRNLAYAAWLADEQTRIFTDQPSVRAAAAACAVGMAQLLRSKPLTEVVASMIEAAERFDVLEKAAKPLARKQTHPSAVSAQMISEQKVLTSDLIAYAYYAGSKRLQLQHDWSAARPDELIAGTIYYLAQSTNLEEALEAARASHACALASLTGAFAGALYGYCPNCARLDSTGLEFERYLRRMSKKIGKALMIALDRSSGFNVPL